MRRFLKHPHTSVTTGAVKSAIFLYDWLMGGFSMFLILHIRYLFEGQGPPDGILEQAILIFLLSCTVSFFITRSYTAIWRFTAWHDVVNLAKTSLLTSLIFLLILFFLNRGEGIPRASLFLVVPLFFLLMLMGRLLVLSITTGNWKRSFRHTDLNLPPALVVGHPDSLESFLKDWEKRKTQLFRIEGLIERQHSYHAGRSMRGIDILGGSEKIEPLLLHMFSISQKRPRLILADSFLERSFVKKLIRIASETGACLIRYRSDNKDMLTPLEAADLIERLPQEIDLEAAHHLIKDQCVMVTGAGGTIGSELVHQLSRLGPQKLILVDNSEFALYRIDLEMQEAPFALWETFLADVCDKDTMSEIMSRTHPDIVFHAAALKHVPLMETHPFAALRVNVGGTVTTAQTAYKAGAQRFVLVSTDKAVNPTNIMGASKRLAELYVLAMAAENKDFAASIVRFGNVLGSAGSVVPLFERQIARGGPVTVTHKDMTRYFMTCEEAVSLMLQAAALTQGGESVLYVLDMGSPVSIEKLARELIRLRGFVPDEDVSLVYTGLRPGEKLHEELVYATENLRPTQAEGVMKVQESPPSFLSLSQGVKSLLDYVKERNALQSMQMLSKLVPVFHSGCFERFKEKDKNQEHDTHQAKRGSIL